MHMAWNFCPQFYALPESNLKIMKNGINNLFTAHLIPKLSGNLYFYVMTSLVSCA
jgi:hypothetical protein